MRRVVLCSGKVYYDLLKLRQEEQAHDVALLRVEQFYPFPEEQLQRALLRYRKAKDVLTGLNLASGMALGYGGIFVVQQPYLLFYRLTPGTDRPAGDP